MLLNGRPPGLFEEVTVRTWVPKRRRSRRWGHDQYDHRIEASCRRIMHNVASNAWICIASESPACTLSEAAAQGLRGAAVPASPFPTSVRGLSASSSRRRISARDWSRLRPPRSCFPCSCHHPPSPFFYTNSKEGFSALLLRRYCRRSVFV